MTFYECMKLALSSLKTNKMRSALTLLGIVIGIASVIAMMSIGEGGRRLVSMELAGLGSNLIFVQPDYAREAMSGARRKSLTYEDAQAIRKGCPAVGSVSVSRMGLVTVKYGKDRYNISATFTDEGLSTTHGAGLKEGRFLQELDIRAQRQVAILGGSLANKLFGEESAIGTKVKINGQSFAVVGVMKEQGRTIFGENPSDMSAYLPITHSKRMTGSDEVAFISCEARDMKQVRDAMDQIEKVLAQRHGKDASFNVVSSASILETTETIARIFTVILGGIGGISLLVGGIGVMNIMLVSVTERTREVGIRKAVGAKKADILRQFLFEAISLCLVGGAMGIVLGWAGAALIAKIAKWPTYVSLFSIAVAVISASFSGVAFGVYPAYKAANLDPIEALRYE
ncbi:MAG TPA: FtsX-like permease family protein [Firmicutes bacterium]|jgi:putative ABC transport system permease protein|nr:FtsX-like permease family protein [Bacillota bacterium]